MKNLTSKMIGLALAFSSVSYAQEEQKQAEPQKQELTWEEKYNQAVEQQIKERSEAFKNGAPDERVLAELLERQRNRFIQLEKERQKQ